MTPVKVKVIEMAWIRDHVKDFHIFLTKKNDESLYD
jgi:hypothetical protein